MYHVHTFMEKKFLSGYQILVLMTWNILCIVVGQSLFAFWIIFKKPVAEYIAASLPFMFFLPWSSQLEFFWRLALARWGVSEACASLPSVDESKEATLVCTLSLACDVTEIPMGERMLVFPIGSSFLVGREQQKEFFERFAVPEHLTAISRSHFEIEHMDGPGSIYEVRNLSVSPISLGAERLETGMSAKVSPQEKIDFIMVGVDGSSVTTFLQLRLHEVSRQGGSLLDVVSSDQNPLWMWPVGQDWGYFMCQSHDTP